VREVLPILLAVRDPFQLIFDAETKEVLEVWNLFHKNTVLSKDDETKFLKFFCDSGLKDIFENHKITNLNDYVFWVEAWLNSNARKNRSGTQMEKLVESIIEEFCVKKWYEYKEQANAAWIEKNWGVEIQSDKAKRRYDYAIYNGEEVFLVETNFYWWGGSKLKAVAGEFSGLYKDMKEQWIKFFWITDWSIGWKTTSRPLEDAYNIMEWNIYNISMLKNGILDELIR
jgi:type II restriction enzyme